MMIPYLLAENPDMSRQDAFAESKRMMDGNKMDAFVLDLSFIGWFILGAITFNIVNILYTTPYMELAHAELYHTLKHQNNESDQEDCRFAGKQDGGLFFAGEITSYTKTGFFLLFRYFYHVRI